MYIDQNSRLQTATESKATPSRIIPRGPVKLHAKNLLYAKSYFYIGHYFWYSIKLCQNSYVSINSDAVPSLMVTMPYHQGSILMEAEKGNFY